MVEPRLPIGGSCYLRHFQRETISGLYPARVVWHDDDGLLLWTPQSSRYWFPYMPDGRMMRDTPLPEWHGAEKVWRPYEVPHAVLGWHARGVPYSVLLFFRDGAFANYYVNIQEPTVAWHDGELFGADTEDWDLDVLVDPDLTWRLKDVDELETRMRWPDLYWVADPRRVHGIVAEVVAVVEAGAFPFDGTWRDFTPDPQWSPIVDPVEELAVLRTPRRRGSPEPRG